MISQNLLRLYFFVTSLIACFAWVPSLVLAQTESVSVSVINGEQVRCAFDSMVTVVVNPNPERVFTEIRLFWTEDGDPVTIRPGDPLEHSFRYPISDLLNACEYTCRIENGFCQDIRVSASYETGTNENNSLIVTFKIPPTPFFFGASSCIGNAVLFENQTCPSNDEDMSYSWAVNGTEVSTDVSPSLTFSQPGITEITLAATNLCGTRTARQNINVTEPASAFALADSNITSSNGQSFVICGSGRLGTRLIADGSVNATRFQWSGSSGVRFEGDRNNDTTRVSFNRPGTYTVTLEVDNVCAQPSTTELTFEVIEAQSLTLNPTSDECLELSYTPRPLVENATYTINGQTYSPDAFPVTLPASMEPYAVEARLINPCGEQVRRDTFFVRTPEAVSITSPAADTSVCENTMAFDLRASRPGGQWAIDGRAASDEFDPADFNPGTFTIAYELGAGNCATRDDLQIEITPGPQVNLGGNTRICQDGSPVFLEATPVGGTWSGPGITDPQTGLFDPIQSGTGQFDIRYTVESAGDGCQGEGQKSVEVVSLPSVEIPDSTLVCAGSGSILLSDLISPQTDPSGGALAWTGPGVNGDRFDPEVAGGIGVYRAILSYTIDPGCRATDSIALRVDALTTAIAPADTTLCSNQGRFLLQGSPAGGTWLDQNNRTINPNLNLEDLPTGTQTFTYVLSQGTSCESSASFQLNLINAEGLQAGEDIYVCETETSIQLPDRSGLWSGAALIDERTVDLTQLSIDQHTYVLTDPSLPSACNTDELVVFRTPLPVPGFLPDSTGCVDAPIVLENTSQGADRYRWTFGDGNASTQANPNHRYQTAGIYTIRLEAFSVHPLTNRELCTAETSAQVRIFQPPKRVAFDPSMREGCSPLTVDFSNQSEGEQLGFQWNFGNGVTSSERSPTEIAFEAGLRDTVFAVRLSVGNGCGDAEAVDSIRVLAQPTARFATEIRSEYCSGEIVSIGHSSMADRLEWDFGNGTSYSGEEPPDQQYTTGIEQNDTIHLQLLAFNQCGVDTATQQLVIVPTDARAAISVATDKPCRGDTIFLESLSRPLDALVTWTLPDGSQRNGSRVPVVFDDIGPQRIEVSVQSCGQDSSSLVLDVQNTPTLSLMAPVVSCPGEWIDITLQTDGEPQWINVSGDTTFQSTQATIRVDSIAEVVIEALAQNAAGCQTAIRQLVDVVAGPEARIAPIDSVCVGSPTTLLSTSTGSMSCLWRLPDGTQRSGCSVTHAFDQFGAQSVDLIVRSEIGCRDSISAPVFVRNTPAAAFDLLVLDTCTPAQILLIDQSDDADELAWWLPDGRVLYGDSLTFVQNAGGTFVVELRAGNEGICFSRTTRTGTVFPSPLITLNKTENCTQQEGFTLEAITQPTAFVSVFGPGYDDVGTLHTGLQPGDYFISAETPNGCIADSTTSIPPVNELLASIVGPDSFQIELGETIPVEVAVNLADAQVLWSPEDFIAELTSRVTTIRPFRSGNVLVNVTDSRGCFVTDTVYVEVIIDRERGLFIPNAFTPNGDGNNDVFRIRSSNPGLEAIEDLRIYGPGGELVFSTAEGQPNDEIFGWDGRFNGQQAQAGVYIYTTVLRYVDGEKLIRKGDVNLIR